MTDEQMTNILVLMRGTWPNMYLRDEGELAWRFWLEDKNHPDVLRSVVSLSERQSNPPSVFDLVTTLREIQSRKFTCSMCGHHVASETALSDHLYNVHGVS